MLYCKKCGSALHEGALFCSRCGETVAIEPAGAQPVNQFAYQPASPSHQGRSFVKNYLGFVILGVFFLFSMIAGLGTYNFSNVNNLRNILMQFGTLGIIALGTAVSTKIKGPDLSIGSMMTLASVIIATTAVDGSIVTGVILAVLVCGFSGLVNGIIISFLRAPAIIITLIASISIRGIAIMLTEGMAIPIDQYQNMSRDSILPFLISVIIAFAALLLAGKLPMIKVRFSNDAARKIMEALGYGLTAVIAVFAGLALTLRVGAATPSLGSGYELMVLLVFAAVQSSRLLDNPLLALGYGLIAAFAWTIAANILALMGVSVYLHTIVQAFWVLILFCVACAAQGRMPQAVLETDVSDHR